MDIQCEACGDDNSPPIRILRGTEQFHCKGCRTPLCRIHSHLSPEQQTRRGVLCKRCQRQRDFPRWRGAKLFETGELEVTPAALKVLGKKGPWPYLEMHQAGVWGDISLKDWAENDLALAQSYADPHSKLMRDWLSEDESLKRKGGLLCSRYLVGWRQVPVYVFTPAHRRHTWMCLEEEMLEAIELRKARGERP